MTERKTKSLRGVDVDFNLLDIKSQIINIMPTDLAKERSELIKMRRRRASKRVANNLVGEKIERARAEAQTEPAVEAVVEEPVVEVRKRRIVKKGE